MPGQGVPVLKPVTFAGEGFSEYFCTQLLGTDPQLRQLARHRRGGSDLQEGFGRCSLGPAHAPRP